ncbi:MAG: serine/threonine protein kinase [Myxococcales bacterium]|nr:serine/threonine protein kinase [Myxococcales bacterium]
MAEPGDPTAADPFRGTQYRALRQLGAGGMGEVYEVEHEIVGRLSVAKVLRLELAKDPAVADRMRVEAQALAALSHRNIVNVTDFARTADGRPFYVMEQLDGCTLGEDYRSRGAYPVDEAIGVVRQILAGLSAAHELGLVHRDIKLDNVFLHATSSGERVVKLLDFGVAKVLAGRGSRAPAPLTLPTADGAIVGTPRYVSPEQVLAKGIDHRADIYATGLVLYTLVCGRGPFDQIKRQEDFFIAHLGDDPPAPSDVARQPLPHELDAAILRAIRKNPADRFQSAAEFSAALEAISSRRTARMGWLETTPSDPAKQAVAPLDSDHTAPDAELEQRLRGESTTAPTRGGPRASTRTEVIEVAGAAPQASAELPTLTARGAPAPPAAAGASTVPNANKGGSPVLAYSSAALVAVVVSALGLWLVDTRSIAALAAVLLASMACATVTARFVPTLLP